MSNEPLNWNTWLKQGDQYLRATSPKGDKNKFNTEIRYNLLSMSFESYAMAILDFNKTLPDNHTYTDLMNALDHVIVINPELKSRILKYENIQSICSIDKYHINKPTEENLDDLKGAISEIAELAHVTCK